MSEGQAEKKGLALLKGLLQHYPFVLKNFKHYSRIFTGGRFGAPM
jgi:hypothetical protein